MYQDSLGPWRRGTGDETPPGSVDRRIGLDTFRNLSLDENVTQYKHLGSFSQHHKGPVLCVNKKGLSPTIQG